jgi:copper chaperone NosL
MAPGICRIWGRTVSKKGRFASFDGTEHIFRYYQRHGTCNRVRKVSVVEPVIVIDYHGLRPARGLGARVVIGSGVAGPMGKDRIPFDRDADADEFFSHQRPAIGYQPVSCA